MRLHFKGTEKHQISYELCHIRPAATDQQRVECNGIKYTLTVANSSK